MISFFRETFVKLGIPFIASSLLFTLISIIPFGDGWLSLIVKSGVSVLIYVLVMTVVGLNEYERNLFLSLIKRKLLTLQTSVIVSVAEPANRYVPRDVFQYQLTAKVLITLWLILTFALTVTYAKEYVRC